MPSNTIHKPSPKLQKLLDKKREEKKKEMLKTQEEFSGDLSSGDIEDSIQFEERHWNPDKYLAETVEMKKEMCKGSTFVEGMVKDQILIDMKLPLKPIPAFKDDGKKEILLRYKDALERAAKNEALCKMARDFYNDARKKGAHAILGGPVAGFAPYHAAKVAFDTGVNFFNACWEMMGDKNKCMAHAIAQFFAESPNAVVAQVLVDTQSACDDTQIPQLNQVELMAQRAVELGKYNEVLCIPGKATAVKIFQLMVKKEEELAKLKANNNGVQP